MLNGLEYHGRPGDTPGGEIFLEFTIERDADEMVVKDGTSYKVHVVKSTSQDRLSRDVHVDSSCSLYQMFEITQAYDYVGSGAGLSCMYLISRFDREHIDRYSI